MYKGKRIGLALGGGGARAFAHLGILRLLKRAGVEVDVIAGSSMGALIPIAYMQQKNFDQTNSTFKAFVLRFSAEFRKMRYAEAQDRSAFPLHQKAINKIQQIIKFIHLISRPYVENATIIENIVKRYIAPGNLESLPQKMYVSTIDAVTGQQVLLDKGNIQTAVIAAASIAGYFPAIPLNERLLTDSQQVFPVPIQTFLIDPVDIIIAVDVSAFPTQNYIPNTGIDMLFRQADLTYSHIQSELESCSDIFIQPQLDNTHWTDFHKLDMIMKTGVIASKDLIEQLNDLCAHPNRIRPIAERPWHTAGYRGLERTVVRQCDPYIFGE